MPKRGKKKSRAPAKKAKNIEKSSKRQAEDQSDVDSDVSADENIKWEFDEDKRPEVEDSDEESDDQDDGDGGEGNGYQEDDECDGDDGQAEEPATRAVQYPEESVLSSIKNKLRRHEMYVKYKSDKKKAQREARDERQKAYKLLGDKAPPKPVPRTIENTREPDVTMVDPEDEEVKEDEAVDEFSSYFKREREPKILITTSDNPHTKTIKFSRELRQTIPNTEFRFRNRTSIKKMVKSASTLGYTDVIVVNEDLRNPNGLLVIHLPSGPTAYFRLASVKYCKQIKHRAKMCEQRPEVIINNFNTRLGHTIGRMFASLLHFDPEFHGRRVVTFHNQRDYIFFRHHRYEFKNGEKVKLQEVGPRFSLKLKWVQNGTFDTKFGEYEWLLKRHEMETSRRRFFL